MLVAEVAPRNLHAEDLAFAPQAARGVDLHVDGDDLAGGELQLPAVRLHGLEVARKRLVQLAVRDPHLSPGARVGRRAVEQGHGYLGPVLVDLLHGDEQVHVVVPVRLDEGVELHVPRELGVLLEPVVELRDALVAVVGDGGGRGRVLALKAHGPGVQVELPVLGPRQGKLALRTPRYIVLVVGVHHVDAHLRGELPPVVDVLAVAVEERLELLHILTRVEIGPLELAVHPEPLLLRGNLAVPVDGATAA